MFFRDVKHVRPLKWLFYIIDWLIYPVAPSAIIIVQYNLYEKVGNKWAFWLIILVAIVAFFFMKRFINECKLTDANSFKEHRIRLIFEGIYTSLKYVVLIFIVGYTLNGIINIDAETTDKLLKAILVFASCIGCRIVEIWFSVFTIKPLEFTMKNRSDAFRKSEVEYQQKFIHQ